MNDDNSGNILIADDDPDLRQTLSAYFAAHKVPTFLASNGTELEQQIALNDPGLIILDLKLDGENGLDLLRSIRSRSDIPIIIVTGRHVGELDCVIGLEYGADDYVGKPFSLMELLARIRVVLRRQRMKSISARRSSSDCF